MSTQRTHSKSQFQPGWLEQTDKNGHGVSLWLKDVKGDRYSAFCKLCIKKFDVSKMGWAAVLQHASGKGHKSRVSPYHAASGSAEKPATVTSITGHFMKTLPDSHIKKPQNKVLGSSTPGPSTSKGSPGSSSSKGLGGSMKSHLLVSDQVTKAEALWAMKTADGHFPFSTSENLPGLFREMFPDSVIAKQFSMSSTKVSYLLSHGLGPLFADKLTQDIIDSGTFYTLYFDETTTVQNKKQFDLLVRFWSESRREVEIHFLQAIFMGHSTAEKVVSAFVDTITARKLPLTKLLSVSSDGPNVNKSIKKKLETAIQGAGGRGLVDVGFCSIHMVHNSFGKGISEFGSEVESLVIETFYFFKKSPCRQEDMERKHSDMEMEVKKFLKHGQTRWLTLIPAVIRLKELLPALKEYLKSVSSDKDITRNEKYRAIQHKLQSKEQVLMVQMCFLESVKPIFDEFLTCMQATGPLIHSLHLSMVDVLTKLSLRLTKPSCLTGSITDWDFDKHQLEDKHLEIGEETKAALQKVKSEADRKSCYRGMRNFLVVVLKYLQKTLPLNNKLLKCLQCLHPEKRKECLNVTQIKYIAHQMPCTSTAEVTSVVDEYKMYQLEKMPSNWKEDEKPRRIDHYWRDVLDIKTSDGQPKYPYLSKVVKCALTLSHGQADNERSLSINKKLLRDDRAALSYDAINGTRLTKDAVLHSGKVQDVTIDQDMLKACRTAHQMYRQQKELEKQKEEEEKKRKKTLQEEQKRAEERQKQRDKEAKGLEEQQKKLEQEWTDLEKKLQYNKELMTESQERMEKAIKDQNSFAIETAHKLNKVAVEEASELQEKMILLGKRKSDVITKLQKVVKRARK